MFRRLLLTAFASFLAVPFSVSAQEAVAPVEPPAFLKDVQSKADFDRLTPEQRREVETFMKSSPAGPSLAGQAVTPPSGTADCLDYYAFGSVQVDVESSVSATVPGVPVTFTGTVRNANPYPVIGGSVYAKVFRKQTDDALAHQNGHFLVDQFVVKKDVTLRANGEEPITFDWAIPRTAPSGEYEIAMFFYTADRFNLLGLTFTDDVVGNKDSFSIQSDVEGEIAFDKNGVTLNGRGYRFASSPPRFTKDEPVKAEVKIGNTTEKDQSVALSWTLYNWDALRESNRIDQKKEMITLKPGESKSLSYETREYEGAASFLVVEAEANGQKSILDIRWMREGVSETRINFPGILRFPLKAGEPNTVFSCAHSTSLPLVENSEIEMILKDVSGKTIHEYVYRGGITGAMMGVKDDFTPKRDYGTFTLSTVLRKDGQIVEALDLRYDCERIDPSLCPDERGAMTGAGNDFLGSFDKGMLLALLAVIVVLLALLIWKLWRVRKGPSTRIHAFFLALLLSSGLLFGGAGEAEAKSVVVSGSTPMLYYEATSPEWENLWAQGLSPVSYSVTYHADVFDNATGSPILPGSSVPVGTEIRFEPSLGAVAFVGTGTSSDTPYGTWMEGAAFPDGPTYTYYDDNWGYLFRGGQCSEEFKTNSVAYTYWPDDTLDIYTPFSAHPPVITLSRDASSQAKLSCTGNLCVVLSPGAIDTDFVFSQTYGKFWYEYYSPDTNTFTYHGCHSSWNGLPMRYNCSPIIGSIESWWGASSCPDGSTEKHDIPLTIIPFGLIAVDSGNSAPAAPLIKGSADMSAPALAVGFTGTSYAFHFHSADPEGNEIRYGIDWNNNGIVDQWRPAPPGQVASGTVQTANRSWVAPGTYTFRVLAQDSNGASSGWTTHTIVVSDPTTPPSTLELCLDNGGMLIPVASGNGSTYAVQPMIVGDTKTFQVFYDFDAIDCGGSVPVTGSAVWNAGINNPNDAVSFSSAGVLQANANGTESVTVSHDGQTITMSTNVSPVCVSSCTPVRRAQECSGVSFSGTDSCGAAETCTGTRYCDFNWKEVTPGR